MSETEVSFLDLHLSILDGFIPCKSYDTCDDFDFEIVNFPYLGGDVPRRASYGIYISQLIRFAKVSKHVSDFITRKKLLPAEILTQSYRYHLFIYLFEITYIHTYMHTYIHTYKILHIYVPLY